MLDVGHDESTAASPWRRTWVRMRPDNRIGILSGGERVNTNQLTTNEIAQTPGTTRTASTNHTEIRETTTVEPSGNLCSTRTHPTTSFQFESWLVSLKKSLANNPPPIQTRDRLPSTTAVKFAHPMNFCRQEDQSRLMVHHQVSFRADVGCRSSCARMNVCLDRRPFGS